MVLKCYYYLLLYFGVLFLPLTTLLAQANVQATLSQNRIFIGDKTQIFYNVTYPVEHDVVGLLTDSLQQTGLEYTLPKAWESSYQSSVIQNSFVTIGLQAFDADTLDIPPIGVLINTGTQIDTLYSLPIRLSILPIEPDSSGLLPIKPILIEPKTLEDYLIFIGIAVALLLTIAIMLFMRKKKKSDLEKHTFLPQITPSERALKNLKLLAAKNLLQKGQEKTYASEMSYILRTYLAEAYDIDALEQPSSRVLEQLASNSNPLLQAQLEKWRQILNTTDAIKFANVMPTKAACDELMSLAQKNII